MIKAFLGLAAFCLLFLVSGCTTSESPDSSIEILNALVIEPLGSGNSGALRDTTEAVFLDVDEWLEFAEGLSPLEPFPQVDTTQMMVLVAAVPTNAGGYQVFFESVEATAEELVATYELSVPGHDCLTVTALSLAFQAVVVPKSDLPVRFVREERYYSCST